MIIPNKNEITNVLKLSANKRYEYFIKKVVDTENIWSLRESEGWALIGDDKGNTYMPLWPLQAFASLCATKDWEGYKTELIDINYFLEEFIYTLKDNNILPCIFLTLEDRGICPFYDDLINS